MLLKTPLATMLPAVVLLSAPLVTGAQESGGVLEEVVVTGTRSEQVLGEMPGNTAVVTSEELELISATHPTEIFTRTPGVLVSRGGSGQEHLTAIRSPVFTGPGACGEFLLAQDGVQLRPTGFCNVNELLQANTEQAARIEVLRGPGTVFYGSNALHGIINVIRQRHQRRGLARRCRLRPVQARLPARLRQRRPERRNDLLGNRSRPEHQRLPRGLRSLQGQGPDQAELHA
jgi:outer membrane cobalamin receptor